MTEEEYLEAKRLRNHYHGLVCEYEAILDRNFEADKKQWIVDNFPKGTMINYKGGGSTAFLVKGDNYKLISINKPHNSIYWYVRVINNKGTYTNVPEYCFPQIREFDINHRLNNSNKLKN